MNIFLTVDVEEWFHSNWFYVNKVISKYYGNNEPITDVLSTTQSLIELFDKHNARATFFLLGKTAIKYPALIDILEQSPHELACHGFYHNKIYSDDNEFQRDVKRFKNEVKADVNGFRFSNFGYTDKKLQILVKEGFSYDSSVVPCLKIPGWYGESDAPLAVYEKKIGDGMSITEFPLSVMPYLRLPGSGGWFLRNIGYMWTKFVVKSAMMNSGYGMIYIHPWEISTKNPNFKEIPFHVFRNAGNPTFKNLEKLIVNFSGHDFITLSDYMHQKRKNK